MDLHTIKFGLGIAFSIIGVIGVVFYLYVKILAQK